MTAAPETRRALLPNWSLKAIDEARPFLPEFAVLDRAAAQGETYDAVLSQPGRHLIRDQRLAADLGARHLVLRDGLLRSVGPAAPAISALLDQGDAPAASALPEVVGRLQAGISDAGLLEEAGALLRFKLAEGLSRINGYPAYRPAASSRPSVLVVDRSSQSGPDGDYKAMLRRARAAHPKAQVILQRDPAAPSAFNAEDLALVDVVLDRPVDAVGLIETVEAVYTVDSLLGLEAVLCGRPVTCFGAPFYAGWGLTTDAVALPDRTTRQTRESLFAAGYLVAARYADPLTGEPCSPRVAFERMAAFRRHARRVAGRWVALNIPPPKQGVIRSFLAGPMSTYAASTRLAPKDTHDLRLAAWTSRPNKAVRDALAQQPSAVTHIEDGFLRSVGLGSGFQPAASIVLDSRGAYYDPNGQSDLIEILGRTAFDSELLERAAALRRLIVGHGLSKYNLGAADAPPVTAPHGARVLLVTGQVESDQSLLTGGGGLTNLSLLERVRRDHPNAHIIYKEHPDVTAGHRPGRISVRQASRLADEVVGPANITRLIEAADEVHTITSLSGFEALLREKVVVTYGRPFYSGWGLTTDRADAPPRPRPLSLDALVAGALMIYPLYLDPITRLPCDALTFVSRLAMLRDASPTPIPASFFGGVSRYIEAVRHTLRPAQPPAY
jgi:capsular polysaccharide export protein